MACLRSKLLLSAPPSGILNHREDLMIEDLSNQACPPENFMFEIVDKLISGCVLSDIYHNSKFTILSRKESQTK